MAQTHFVSHREKQLKLFNLKISLSCQNIRKKLFVTLCSKKACYEAAVKSGGGQRHPLCLFMFSYML